MEFAFAPIYSLGYPVWEERFDLSRLPFEISDGLTIEDISGRLSGDAFALWKTMLGESLYEQVERVKYAIVQRYSEDDDHVKKTRIGLAVSCLRLIRPMRQNVVSVVRGEVRKDGSLDVKGFDLSQWQHGVEVVEAHKLSSLRLVDAEELRRLFPQYIKGMEGEYWKFRMAVQFHDLGYFQSYNWKPRFLLWASALESIFTSRSTDHQGSRVSIARIKSFLGGETRIYPREDWPSTIPECTLTLDDVLDDIYEFRNLVAHGDKVPDSHFQTFPRRGINGNVCAVEVLSEAISFIIRASLIKILNNCLLDHFADAGPAEAYFGAQGLVNSKLPKGASGASKIDRP